MKKVLLLVFISFLLLKGIGTPPIPSAIVQLPKVILYKGWNLVAPPTSKTFHTSSIKNATDIYMFDSHRQLWLNGLNTYIPPGVGMWVNVSTQSKIDYKYSPSNNFKITDFNVTKGWNMLGMSLESERINIISLNFNALGIYVYDAKNAKWIHYEPYSRSSLKAGMGFWLETE